LGGDGSNKLLNFGSKALLFGDSNLQNNKTDNSIDSLKKKEEKPNVSTNKNAS